MNTPTFLKQIYKGKKELNERKDLRIVLTDKSKKMMIVTNETYKKMVEVYTKDAKKLDERRNRKSPRIRFLKKKIRQLGTGNCAHVYICGDTFLT